MRSIVPLPTEVSGILRLVGLVLVVSAEGYIIGVVGENFSPVDHFSFFTVMSNLIGAAVLAAGVLRPVPDWVRGAAVTYLVTTGIVYAVLLRGADVQTPGYGNLALHVLMPILITLDWLLSPPAARIRLRTAALWLLFPVAYLAYTLLRGPWADWYPYPFLDPREDGGYRQVALMCSLVAVAVAVVAAAVWAVGNRVAALGNRDATPSAPAG